ncbi:hypothetical protein MKX03_013193 [Papaver bracteatum]|nr:hypothetical protein MKX03_013193 [Papaver bracteatum]
MRGTVVDKLTEETSRDWSHVQELLSACEGNHGQPMSCFYSMVPYSNMQIMPLAAQRQIVSLHPYTWFTYIMTLFSCNWKQIKNPNYKGKWKAPMIDNPDFKDDPEIYVYPKLKYVGIELWQVKSGTMFDNVLVCYDPDYAKKLAEETWGKQKEGEKAAFDEELELCLDDTIFEKQSAPFALVISHFVLINM